MASGTSSSSRLMVCHVNCQSLYPHFDEFRLHFAARAYHIICLSETWLRSEITDSMVTLRGYTLLRRDRVGVVGGGVGVYVRQDVRARVIAESAGCRGEPEFMLLQVTVLGQAKILLGVVYRPPGAGSLRQFEGVFTAFLPEFRHVIVMGDFNHNVDVPSTGSRDLLDFVSSNGLHLVQHGPTHHTASVSTRIDLCFVADASRVADVGQYPVPFLSRHDLIYIRYAVGAPRRIAESFLGRCLGRMDVAAFRRDLAGQDWRPFYESVSVDDKVRLLSEAVTRVLDVHAPEERVTLRRRVAPWLTGELLERMRRRDRLRQAFRKVRTQRLEMAFRQCRDELKRDLRAARDAFYVAAFSAAEESADVWSLVRQLGILPGRKVAMDPVVSLEELNAHFLSAGSGGALGDGVEAPVGPFLPGSEFAFAPVEAAALRKVLARPSANTAGVDGLSMRMVRAALPVIGGKLLHLYNFSLVNSVFPERWKRALVCPVPKVKSPVAAADYRPISLLCCLSKILERLVADQVVRHMERWSLFDPFQSAFRASHSTQSALLRVVEDAREAIDQRLVMPIVFFDFSKAFDCVDHGILLGKLVRLNFAPSAVAWFGSYLGGRSQAVRGREGACSGWGALRSGVPQGSVLGPLLFSVFVQGLGDVVPDCSYSFYADDLQIYCRCFPFQLPECIGRLNGAIAAVGRWSASCGLRLNPGKTRAMVFGSARIVSRLLERDVPPVLVGGDVVPFSDSVTCLGVRLHRSLVWREHVHRVARKVHSVVYQLKLCRSRLPASVRRALVISLVFPHLDYCCLLLTDLPLELESVLQRSFNRGVRFVVGARRDEHITPYLARLGWLRIVDRRKLLLASFVFAVRTDGRPGYLFERIGLPVRVLDRSLRRPALSIDCVVPFCRTEGLRRSFVAVAARLWNSIPPEIRRLGSVGLFKRAYMALLLEGMG